MQSDGMDSPYHCTIALTNSRGSPLARGRGSNYPRVSLCRKDPQGGVSADGPGAAAGDSAGHLPREEREESSITLSAPSCPVAAPPPAPLPDRPEHRFNTGLPWSPPCCCPARPGVSAFRVDCNGWCWRPVHASTVFRRAKGNSAPAARPGAWLGHQAVFSGTTCSPRRRASIRFPHQVISLRRSGM